MDVANDAIMARNLSMPHSPRLYDGKIWLLQAGTGEFGFIAPATGQFETVAFCPGFVRGLAFHGKHALVGTSLARTNQLFSGLPLEDGLAARNMAAECAVHVVALESGKIEHRLRLGGAVREFYEVAVLPGVTNAGLLGIGAFGAGVPDLARLTIRGPDLTLDTLMGRAGPAP
jgi:uncharacterized protein (TIGR03032 family)